MNDNQIKIELDEQARDDAEPDTPRDNRNLFQRFHAACSRVAYLQKDTRVSDGRFAYNAITFEKVMMECRAALLSEGIVSTCTLEDWGQQTIDTIRKGEHVPVDRAWALCRTSFMYEDEVMSVMSLGYGQGNDDKNPGKAMTYAAKYGLMRGMMIPTGDDPDQVTGQYDVPVTRDRKAVLNDIAGRIDELSLDGNNVKASCHTMYGCPIEQADTNTLEDLLESITNSPDMYRNAPTDKDD